MFRVWLGAVCVFLAGCVAQPVPTIAPPAFVSASAAVSAAPLIVLDPGHNPVDGGAVSVRGTKEISYNDRFVAELAPAFRAAGWRVRMTRAPGETLSLVARAQRADDLRASLFLSVHHDSVQLRCLRRVIRNGLVAFKTRWPMGGYSLYVSREHPDFTQSYRFAALLGEQLHALGRPPLLAHAGTRCGESRPLLDARLGIYRYDHLAVLRHNRVPAILLEVGVITDVEDESYVGNAGNRSKMIAAIVRAADAWARSGSIRYRPSGASPVND